MQTSEKGLALIKEFEGYRATAYRDPVGIWTIGYGRTRHVREGQEVTPLQANEYLREDVADAERDVARLVRVPLTQNEFDALVSWTFNLGGRALSASTLLRRLNFGKHDQVPEQMLRWVYAGGEKLAGLERRRAAEAAMWRGE